MQELKINEDLSLIETWSNDFVEFVYMDEDNIKTVKVDKQMADKIMTFLSLHLGV